MDVQVLIKLEDFRKVRMQIIYLMGLIFMNQKDYIIDLGKGLLRNSNGSVFVKKQTEQEKRGNNKSDTANMVLAMVMIMITRIIVEMMIM